MQRLLQITESNLSWRDAVGILKGKCLIGQFQSTMKARCGTRPHYSADVSEPLLRGLISRWARGGAFGARRGWKLGPTPEGLGRQDRHVCCWGSWTFALAAMGQSLPPPGQPAVLDLNQNPRFPPAGPRSSKSPDKRKSPPKKRLD